jgi:hypothetical protein
MTAPNPFDMNAAIASVVEHQLQDRAPAIMAQTLLIAGNNLRAQAFGMTASINVAQFATKPAQMADGSAIVLLTALKYVPGSYRLFVNPVKLEDGTTVRSILVVDEVEGDLLKTQFVTLSDETKAELNRQLDAVQLPADGTIELCLAIVSQPIEGYEYFKVEEPATPATDQVDTPADAAADAAPTADAAATQEPATAAAPAADTPVADEAAAVSAT